MFGIHRTILQVDKRFEMGTSTGFGLKRHQSVVAPKSVNFTGLTSPKQNERLLTASPASDWYVEVW